MIKQSFVIFFITTILPQVSLLPIHCAEVNNYLESVGDNNIRKRQVECSILQEEAPTGRPPTSDEERKKLQARLFEGLLHFGTIVNHIDTFIMDKSKIILKSLGKMAESEEDKRFEI